MPIRSPSTWAPRLRRRQTTCPNLIDIRDTERNLQRQQDAAARIFAAINAYGRIKTVYVDDVQHVLYSCDPHPQPRG